MDGLPPQLVELLKAQVEVPDELPYDLLGVKRPELSLVYVTESLRRRVVDRKEPERSDGEQTVDDVVERRMTVKEALKENLHLVITGEPGAGKSTVSRLFVRSLSEAWLSGRPTLLREHVVPVRIPARALVAREAWSTLLHEGAKESLGSSLNAPLDPALFTGRVMGARWIVFIDGLDEIADEATTAQVVQTIAQKARQGTDYRLVVTTRRLDERLMGQLESADITPVTLEPFSRDQFRQFAKRWFAFQDPFTEEEHSTEFIRQTEHGQLRELVANPLLATIAAITFTQDPSRPLPAVKVDLYARFMDSLLEGRRSGRNVVAELRRTLGDRPARLRMAEWLGENRTALIRHLAGRRLESETPLLEAAEAWVRGEQPEWSRDWLPDLHAVLSDSGVFVANQTELRFLHHSFAEYLAAEDYADRLPADIPDLDRWIERGQRKADEVLVLFTFVLWSRRPGHDAALVVRRLLSGDAGHVAFAGRLLTDGCVVSDELAAEVVGRITNLIVTGKGELGELLGALGGQVVGDLHELLDRVGLSAAAKVECAIALGRLANPEFAANRLEVIGRSVEPHRLRRIVRGLVDLVPDGAFRAERLLVSLIDPLLMNELFPVAVEVLLEIKRVERAATAIRELVRNAQADHPVGPAWWESPAECATVADIAIRCGCHEAAAWVARRSLNSQYADRWDLANAAKCLVALPGEDTSEEVLAAVVRRPVGHRLHTARALSGDRPQLACSIARVVVSDSSASPSDLLDAGSVLVHHFGDETLAELVDRLERHSSTDTSDWLSLAHLAAENGHNSIARTLARRVFDDPSVARWDLGEAVGLLLRFHVDPEEILAAVESRPVDGRIRVAEAMFVSEHTTCAVALTEAVLQSGVDDVEELLLLVERSVAAGERDLAERVLAVIRESLDRSASSALPDVSTALLSLGRPAAALEVAREALVAALAIGRSLEGSVKCWLDAEGQAGAAAVVEVVLASTADAGRQYSAAEVLAGRGYLPQAVELLLDVLTRKDDVTPSLLIEVATKLVEYGRRDEVIEALRGSRRAELRALLGWVFLSVPGADPAELLKLLR